MANAKYDVGDILTFCVEDRCYATVVIVKWHVTSTYIEGVTLERHTDYDVFIKADGSDFRFIHEAPEAVLYNYKVVGHIDISGMSNKEIETELAYAIACVWHENNIAYAVQDHWVLMKFREPKEESECAKMGFCIPKMGNPFYYDNLTNKLAEECKQKQKHLDLANNKISELKKEVDSLRNSYNDTEARISRNLHNLGFTSEAVYKIMYSD